MTGIASRTMAATPSRRRWSATCLSLVLMVGIMAIHGSPAGAMGAPSPVECTAEGAELFQPALSDDEACAAFAAALDALLAQAGPGPAAREGVAVALRFTRTGVARADVSRDGEALFDASVATMDRPMEPVMIERLARQVADLLLDGSAHG